MTQINDVRGRSIAELHEELDSTQRELMNLRFRSATMQLTDVSEIRRTRRHIARIMTVMRERELTEGSK